MKRARTPVICFVAILALIVPAVAHAAAIEEELGESEVKMGQEAAAEIAKDYRLSTSEADLKHLRAIGAKIAQVANTKEIKATYGSSKVTPFEFQFNIIEDKDINAFALPGGMIYVYRGLLDFVESDDELAAVLAHEVTHACHHHMVYLLKKQASLNNTMAIAMLAAMFGGGGSDIYNIAFGVQLYNIARLNGYGMEAERDADRGAVFLTQQAGFNPVGMLTFMERLAKRPEFVDLGIYRSHPLDSDRVKAARKLLQDLKIPINRRETTKAVTAEVRENAANGVSLPEVTIRDIVIYRPAPASGKSALERANEAARRINAALDSGIKMHEIKVDAEAGAVIGRRDVLIEVSEDDARLMGKSRSQVAAAAAAAIRDVVWKQMVDTVH